MNPLERRMLRFIIGLAFVFVFSIFTLKQADLLGAIPQGDPELVPIGIAETVPPSTTIPPATTSSTTTSSTSTTTSTTTTTLLAGEWRCPEAITIAAEVGWPAAELERLDLVVWRESRCNPSVSNLEGRDRSYGLLQINTKGGLWEHRRDLCGLAAPEALFSPAVNLSCGLLLWQASGWAPWGL